MFLATTDEAGTRLEREPLAVLIDADHRNDEPLGA